MWLFDPSADTTFAPIPRPLEGDEWPADQPAGVPTSDTLTLRFASALDGRGFSTARQLRAKGFGGRLIAAGPLMPDQARHALQSGFDAVLVDDEAVARQGELTWRNALANAVGEVYIEDVSSRGAARGIWAARHHALDSKDAAT
ncbi:MAG: DUF934 domain-containing protein [Pseudomonadota bacterium]